MKEFAFQVLQNPKWYSRGSVAEYASVAVVKAMSGSYGDQTPGVQYLHNINELTTVLHKGELRQVVVARNLNPEYLGSPLAKTLREDEDQQ